MAGGKDSNMYDYPLAETQIIWDACDNPELSPIELVKIPYEDDNRYMSSWGACNMEFKEATPTEQIKMLMLQFVHLAAIDGIKPKAIHQAFMQIPEYRRALAEFGSIDPDQI